LNAFDGGAWGCQNFSWSQSSDAWELFVTDFAGTFALSCCGGGFGSCGWVGGGSWFDATVVNWTFIGFSTSDNLSNVAFFTFRLDDFTFKDWATGFFVRTRAKKFFANFAFWSWSWFTNC
jgi:hypothetical protein